MAQLDQTDFSMKPSIDVASIASVLQRKKMFEIEQKAAQRSQRMNELTQTIGLASNLATNMIEHSKYKQKQDFVKSLSEAMAMTVPQEKMPVQGPTLDNSPLPSVMRQDPMKQNLMRSATLVNPEKASEFALKAANPNLNQDSSFSFQRMTFKGTDGKQKTVNVGILGTQLVNPVTKQPFQGTPEEVDAMPEYGFVEREEYAGTDNEGNPVYRNPVAQTQYTKDANGKPVPHSGPILPKLQNPGDAVGAKIQFIDETRSNLKDAIDKFDPAYVGVIDKKYKDIGAYLEEATDPQAEEFRNLIEEINITRRHEMFGSALTESEKKSFADIALNRNISASAFMARLRTLDRKLQNKEKAILKASKATGKSIRKSESSSFDLGDGWSAEEVTE